MKKTLAMILTLALVICMMPTSAFADDSPGATGTKTLEDSMVSVVSTKLYDGKTDLKNLVTVTVPEASPSENTDYTITWKKGTEELNSTANASKGIYTVIVTSKVGTVFKDVKAVSKTIEITGVDFNNITIEYQGSTLLSNFANFDNAKVGDKITNDNTNNATSIVVKQGASSVDSSLYEVEAYKESANSINLKVSPKVDATGNVSGPVRYKNNIILTVPLTDSTFKVVGTTSLGAIPNQTYSGGKLTPTIYVVPCNATSINEKLVDGIDYTKEYSNNITGNADATVTVTGTGKYSGQITGTFHIDGKSIQGVIVTPESAGQNQKPKIKVTDGNKELVQGKDYTFDDKDFDSSQIGSQKGVATIYGTGNYSGSKKFSYNVAANQFQAGDATVNGRAYGTESMYYTGSSRTATTVSVKKGTVGSSSYTLEYEYIKDGKTEITKAPLNSGDYSIYVVGTGTECAGRILAGTLKILPIPLDRTEIVLGAYTEKDPVSRTYVPKVTLVTTSKISTIDSSLGFKGGVKIPETDYTVDYRYVNYNSSYLKPTVYVTVKKGAVNLTETGSTVKEIKKEFSTATKSIANYLITFEGGRSSSAYTAAGVTPKVVVKESYNSTPLKLTQDYTVTYKNAAGKEVKTLPLKDAGTYSVIVTGTGAYYGSQTLTYTITGTDIGNYTVTLKESKVNADGRSKTPVITSVAYGYASKLNTTDYTVSYQDSTGKEVKAYQMSAPGTYRVVVTGKNGYTGSCYANFTIEGLAQSITGVESSYKIYPTSDAFKLQAKATEGVITYTSSDPSVASVDAYGYVTPHKAGRAKITISTTGNVRYNPANDSTVIKVYPNKAKLTRKPWKTGKGKIKVRWNKQDNVTRYEVRYARNKSFKSGSYKTKKVNAAVNTYTTQSTTISGLRSGYTYYVKVRAVKEVYNDYGKKLTYYGNWSGWKSVRA